YRLALDELALCGMPTDGFHRKCTIANCSQCALNGERVHQPVFEKRGNLDGEILDLGIRALLDFALERFDISEMTGDHGRAVREIEVVRRHFLQELELLLLLRVELVPERVEPLCLCQRFQLLVHAGSTAKDMCSKNTHFQDPAVPERELSCRHLE